ncbi:hypothetical protein WS64_16265 [Burkholderia anthina]|uniref:Uncharacterized protein n=1 Tax=Burkholderia anthina TaxID=179879 RepID=A0AAW3PXX2_9BURK|nr:hypothetical protein WS64_00020 [Burkholderia anthina]KWZ36954.1 hypothetical protein WS64_16265 [Burkholderia anthina]
MFTWRVCSSNCDNEDGAPIWFWWMAAHERLRFRVIPTIRSGQHDQMLTLACCLLEEAKSSVPQAAPDEEARAAQGRL